MNTKQNGIFYSEKVPSCIFEEIFAFNNRITDEQLKFTQTNTNLYTYVHKYIDIKIYTILTIIFNVHMISVDYLTYIHSINVGLKIAGTRSEKSLHLPLRGPAGLFKSISNHTLCWSILDYCNKYLENCPIEVLTYHRKGSGENASVVLNNSKLLLAKIYKKYPNLQKLKISNE